VIVILCYSINNFILQQTDDNIAIVLVACCAETASGEQRVTVRLDNEDSMIRLLDNHATADEVFELNVNDVSLLLVGYFYFVTNRRHVSWQFQTNCIYIIIIYIQFVCCTRSDMDLVRLVPGPCRMLIIFSLWFPSMYS